MARSLLGKRKRTAASIVLTAGRARTHLRKNDTVKVLAGKSKNAVARVLSVHPERGTAIVEGVNFVKRHTKPNPTRNIKGGIAEKESPVHVSNLMVVCPECKKPARVGHRILDSGTKIRICRKCGGSMDSNE